MDEMNKMNESNKKNDIFWVNDPMILFNEKQIMNVWPLEDMSREDKLNSITRLVILLTVLGFVITQKLTILITGMVTVGVIVFLYYSTKNNKEGFLNIPLIDQFYLSDLFKDHFTNPKPTNPVMNVLLPEIQDNPDRDPAAPSSNQVVTDEINQATKDMIMDNFNNDPDIEKKLFNDLGDNFEFEQSMRQFYSTANTTIPNNQKDFAEFCYGDMISCKEGHEAACIRANPRHINY